MTKRPQSSSRFVQVGILTAIPFVLLVGPVIGYYLGTLLDGRWRYAPWGTALGIVVGLLASARVTSQFIRQAQDRRTR
ncbi:MAG: AtpZ/AtpI family protein [Candidatus Omnitrophota bacterium]|nr:AtpZ/AtpI family protein [Candidatus Omnitrophota bacterium]